MQELSQVQQSNTLILVNDYVDALRLVKCIIPYYEGKNMELNEEIKAKLQSEWAPEQKSLLKLENKMEMLTKYYLAKTHIYILKYDDAIQDSEIVLDTKKKNLKFDSIFYHVTALGPKQIYGHDKFCQVADKFNLTFQPQIQTLVYQKSDEFEIDIEYIIKQEEELESFTESVYEDFKKLSEQDKIVKPRAKSMLEETEGIARIIDILESNVWTDSEMFKQEKKLNQEQQQTKLNIHLPTYEKNKDIREKYETYGDDEDEEIDDYKQKKEQKGNTINEINEQKDKKLKESNEAQEQKQKKEINDKKKEVLENENQKNSAQNEESQQKDQPEKNISEQKTENQKQEEKKVKEQKKKYTNDDDEEIQESTFNDFVKILQQMKGIKDNSQQLPDEKRKENAEKFILNLMQTLGLDEESDDGDNEN